MHGTPQIAKVACKAVKLGLGASRLCMWLAMLHQVDKVSLTCHCCLHFDETSTVYVAHDALREQARAHLQVTCCD